MAEILDCLVIGGGPAGLTAALYLGRFRRSVTVIDKGWSRAEWITLSHNLPGFPEGLSGPELLDRLRTQARRYGALLYEGVVETLAHGTDGLFTAQTADTTLRARTVILATGVVENKPPLAHLADAVKSGRVRTCPICDGYESQGKRVAVLGAGEHAAAEALFLRTYTDRLTLLLPLGAPPLSPKTQQAVDMAGIAVDHLVIGSVVLDEHGVTAIIAEDGRAQTFDVVYSAFGTSPQTALARTLGAMIDAAGRLYVTEHQETSIEGLFAAGDLVRGLNQISVAEGEAAIAATAAHNHLARVASSHDA
jgi:thioredoxin reductase (NADPH)